MKTFNNIEIIVSEDNEVSYNYKGILFTKKYFEEQFLPKSKKFIVIYTDLGNTCDGFARVLGVFNTRNEAKTAMDKDIKVWCQSNNINREEGACVDYEGKVVIGDEGRFGCQWQILEVEM